MRRVKQFVILLITILTMIGVCGCMNQAEKECQEQIQSFLTEKYGCEFEILDVDEGYSGSEGQYIYASCESKTHEGESFDVYCYPDDGTKKGDLITIDGKSYVIFEKYAEVCFKNQLQGELTQLLPEDVFVGCKIRFDCGDALHYSVTKAQFSEGMEACLNNKDFYSFVTVYIVADEKADMAAIQAAAEEYAAKYNAHEQLLFFATAPSMDKAAVAGHYAENAKSFGNHMLECDWVRQMQCTEMNRDKGIVERTTEKG